MALLQQGLLCGLGGKAGLGRQALAPQSFVTTAGHGGQARGAQGRSSMGPLRPLQRAAQAAGQQLGPGIAAGTAAHQGQRRSRGRALHLARSCLHRLQPVHEPKAHALHHGTGHVGGIVLGAQAHEDAGGSGIVVGRALAAQVGQKDRGLGMACEVHSLHCGGQLGLGLPGDACQPAKGAGGAEHDRHLVPAARQRVGEGMHGTLGGRREPVGHPEHHARGTQRHKALPCLARTHAHRTGGVVAAAAGHGHPGGQAPAGGHVGAQHARGIAALGQARHVGTGQAAGGEQGVAPIAARHVQPQGAGCIGHVAHRVARELQAQPVLGQQHAADARKHFGLVLAQPQQLGCGKAGHGQVAGDLARGGHSLLQLGAFGRRAAVIPEDGRAQHLALRAQHHGAVHVARQAHAAHLRPGIGRLRTQPRHGSFGSGQPVGRVLLAPGRLGAVLGHRRIGHGVHLLVFAQQQQFDTRGAQVNTQVHALLLKQWEKCSHALIPKRPAPCLRYSLGVMPLMSRKRRLKLAMLLKPTS